MSALATTGPTPETTQQDGDAGRHPAGRLTGTGSMIHLILRRDRILLPVWILIFVASAASSAAAAIGLYPTVQARVAAATAANATPALVAMYGKVYNLASLGGLAMLKLTTLGAVLVAVLMIMVVVRHTRAEEESGRLELMRSGVLGRHAPLAAALAVSVTASVLLGALTAGALAAGGLDPVGSLAFGLCWACAGMAFAAVAAVAAQVTAGARAATGLALTVLGVAFVLRAIGDSAAGGLSMLTWLSPIGWSEQLRPYAGNRWWVALIPVAFTIVVGRAAFFLNGRRDLGAGLVPPRPGPARGAPGLRTPLALAWRLQRGTFIAWAVAFALLALVLGSLASDVGSLLDSPQSRDLITKMGGAQGLTDAFLGTELGIVAIMAAAYGISAVLRMRSEETALRAEPLLATSVTRGRWLTSHVVIALGGTTVLLLVVGLGAGLTYGASTGDLGGAIASLAGAALVRLPAVWLLTGIAVALFGLLPRMVLGAWAALVASLLLGEFGAVLGLPTWVRGISPFAHVPSLPGAAMAWAPTIVLLVIAAVLIAAGVAGFRRRDIG